MALADIMVHTATPILRSKGAKTLEDLVDGDYGVTETRGTPFVCCVFLPNGSEDGNRRGRAVREPTLLFLGVDTAGAPVALRPKDSLGVVAPTLNVVEGRTRDAEVRWEVVGRPQPFGPPGDETIGAQVTIQAVED